MLILISDKFDSALPGLLAKYGQVTDDQNRVAEADIILVRSKTKANAEYLTKAKNLKMIIRGGVGLDNIDQNYCREKAIIVKNTAEASTTAVAELAFALMIALPNHVTLADSSMREGKWLKKELERTELFGKVLGILGMGRIGTALAVRAKAFGMCTLAWHPDVYFSDFAEIHHNLDEVLEMSDYLSLHIPKLPDTKGMINKERLAHVKQGAYMINTGRAEVVVEEDIVEALKSGRLGGFATDVWYSDPPVNSPLFNAPNTIFAPHLGASSKENMTRIGHVIDILLSDYVKAKK
jgi:phosphoglycerate dehydrogenase-like enzyme